MDSNVPECLPLPHKLCEEATNIRCRDRILDTEALNEVEICSSEAGAIKMLWPCDQSTDDRLPTNFFSNGSLINRGQKTP